MKRILKTLKIIKRQVIGFNIPSVSLVSERKDPYLVLISCILSLRTKDRTTIQASERLFRVASNPYKMLKVSKARLERLIYPVSFYRNKAGAILETSRKITEDFSGKVPDRLEDLLSLKGVGRKTANLVLGLAYKIPAVCVDTHVHRVSNRLGWVKTKSPQETEEALKFIFPRKYWIDLNTILVTFGQNICLPVSPYCSKCGVFKFCKRMGVSRFR
ncbi:MAG: endonuclease III [Candidatus Omnitrophica bacterium]|nr:endonuclease III [Candidatus Omnitrophota bacterium]MDD5238208.1 endonuclease III [Candidatus Omnitrophota bacterium]